MSAVAGDPSSWLVVIDMQEVFADPAGGWHAPGTVGLLGPIGRLAAAWEGRVVLTRFVAPAEPAGAWRRYYEEWPWALVAPDDPLYALLDGLPKGPVVTETTFGKWGPGLASVIGDADLVVCGVATDCCVLSTALAAADAGRHVTVAADACAGSSPAAHDRTLALLAGYLPLIEVRTVDDLLGAEK
ncbi:MAG TPA: cysteine hydrolase [Acidimicrobiales bacterium]|nr:cysteine hydrolase [Acidimicrobiales bacterium]